MEVNKIFLNDFFENEEVFKYFFQKSRGSFIQWYFYGVGKKNHDEILGRIEKILGPLDQKLKILCEKSNLEQTNRQKRIKARTKSNPKWSNFAELEQKRKQDEQNSQLIVSNLLRVLKEERWKGIEKK